MRKLLAPFALLALQATAQDPIWAPDVANIIYSHCSICHHEGSIGPFPFMSYNDVADHALSVQEVVYWKHMPPWPADPTYCHFAHENVLTQGEIDAIVDWVDLGLPFGDPMEEPDPPVFMPGGSLLDTIDFQVAIPPYSLQDNTDEYRWFVIENPFTTTVYVNAIEVFAGLDDVVHHADLALDNSGYSLANDLADPLPGFDGNTGSPSYSYYMNAWQPGGNVVRFPPQWGMAVEPDDDFVIEIHYGPGHQGEVDSTFMNLEFVTGTNIRPVSVGWLLNSGNMIDGPLWIPANTVQTFHHEYVNPSYRSMISICPHMHHVGTQFTVWYEYGGDSIPLIRIPDWEFHWQRYYTFQTIQPIPAGAVIKSIGVYDNTPFNEDNPNDPPQNVGAGSTTAAEMFLCYFIWASYQPGDETIVMDSTIITATNEPGSMAPEWSVLQADEEIVVNADDLHGPAELRLIDATGRILRSRKVNAAGTVQERIDVRSLPATMYVVELATSEGRWARRLVLAH